MKTVKQRFDDWCCINSLIYYILNYKIIKFNEYETTKCKTFLMLTNFHDFFLFLSSSAFLKLNKTKDTNDPNVSKLDGSKLGHSQLKIFPWQL